jgi:hypothetical protein
MSPTEHSSHPKVAKLNNDNYHVWYTKLKMLLIAKDLWPLAPLASAGQGIDEKAIKDDNKALSIIVLNIDDDQFALIDDTLPAITNWNALKEHHQNKGTSNRVTLRKNFFRLEKNPDISIEQHLTDFNFQRKKLKNVNIELDDETATCILLNSLPPEYASLVTSVETQQELPSLNFIIDRIKNESIKQTPIIAKESVFNAERKSK